MNCRVSDDHTASYLSATRSQPSCSNRVKAFSPLIMPADHRVHDYFISAEIRAVLLLWRDERCVRPIVFKFWDAMARVSPIVGRFCETPNHEWRLTQTPYNLLQREFDWLFFFARNQLVSLNDSSASIPTKQCIVVARRTNCFRLFKPAHRFAKKLVRLKSAAGCILRQFCFSPTLCKDPCVICPLIFALNSRQKIFGLCVTYAVTLSETIGYGEQQRDDCFLV